jgi:environmental stress-induced protein Ves
MPQLEYLDPAGYRRIPWKNGRGELVIIAADGGPSWENMGVAWHFGRTAINEEGPFSDYTGYERLQVVTKGAGLVLVAPDHLIDLRLPMRPQRYDGGLAIRTRLEQGPVEVVNLIANRAQFDITLHVAEGGEQIVCKTGRHVAYAPANPAQLEIDGLSYTINHDHALRIGTNTATAIMVRSGLVIIGSILDKDPQNRSPQIDTAQ